MRRKQQKKSFKNKQPPKIERRLSRILETIIECHVAQKGYIILPDFTGEPPVYAGINVISSKPKVILDRLADYINENAEPDTRLEIMPSYHEGLPNGYDFNFIAKNGALPNYLARVYPFINRVPHLIQDFLEKKMYMQKPKL